MPIHRFAVVPAWFRPVLTAAGVATLAVAAGCGDKPPSATQVAARVNKQELSVHQINFVLARQPGIRADQTEQAGRAVLERLIEQELAVQRAKDVGVDRDPRVLQEIDFARREILARAYGSKVGERAQPPSDEQVQRYFSEHPELFAERRIYSLQEWAVQAEPAMVADIDAQLRAGADAQNLARFLKSKNVEFSVTPAVRAAEQLPLAVVSSISKMKEGQAVRQPSPKGARLLVLVSSRLEPVDAARARPAIEQFLLNEQRRKLLEDEMKSARAAAQIEYMGAYAAAPAASAEPAASAATAASAVLDEAAVSKGLGTIR